MGTRSARAAQRERGTSQRFEVHETPNDLRVAFNSQDDTTKVSVDVRVVEGFSGSELFADLEQASEFFRHGSAGFSATRGERRLDGLELRTDSWQVAPVEVNSARSTFFEDRHRFPQGSALLDDALLMRDVPVTWRPLPSLDLTSGLATAGN